MKSSSSGHGYRQIIDEENAEPPIAAEADVIMVVKTIYCSHGQGQRRCRAPEPLLRVTAT
jgi:hypothetical protein